MYFFYADTGGDCRARTGASEVFGKLLLAFALFLLSDANLELLQLHVLIGFVIVASHGVRQIRVYIGVFGQDSHQGESFIARRAERAEPFDVRNCHTKLEYHRAAPTRSA